MRLFPLFSSLVPVMGPVMRPVVTPVIAPLIGLALAAPAPSEAQTAPAASQAGTTVQDTAATSGTPASSGTPAALVADKIYITPDRALIAEGNVEAFHGNTRLQASKITFDQTTGKLNIAGPIRIDEGGAVTILANAAELDRDLQNGILRGARMVFDKQVQLAALQMTRVEGRYTQLYKTAVTSCDVCDDGRAPIWAIRAERITHDQQEQQLYFEHAQLRILDVPVFYFPGLRVPDPSLERATGFLVPTASSNSNFGTGITTPYFIKIGDHRDLTVTPYLATDARALELRYRQAFRRGEIALTASHARDNLQPGDSRGRFYASGRFQLERGYQLKFDLKILSDDAYLADYDISDTDRIRSDITLTKVNRDKLVQLGFIRYQSLRDSEPQEFVPTNIIAGAYEKRLYPALTGGELRFGVDILDFTRTSQEPTLTTDPDNPLGRDMSRVSVDVDWRRQWIAAMGIHAEWLVGVGVDTVAVTDDEVFDNHATQITPHTALTLRLPMQRLNSEGDTQVLEPLVQLGWTNVTGPDIPNEASNITEFDQGNLLSLSRFPEDDAREDGLSLAYGVNWTHFDRTGWVASMSLGQILRSKADDRFSDTSGLGGTTSDLLIAGQLLLRDELSITARGLWDTTFDISKAEIRGEWHQERFDLAGTYVWLQEDAQENRGDETNELWLDGSYALSGNWTADANWRYDISDSRSTRAGVGLTYRNECVTLNMSLKRRFTSTESVEASTDFGFTLSLNGFSVKSGNKTYRRSCSST